MQNKKGISDVVTTVLIVLLSLVAIAILWGFLQPLFKGSGVKIQQAEACLNLNLEVSGCISTLTNASVNIRRGAGSANLKEVRWILEKTDGSTVVFTNATDVPGELETKRYYNVTTFKAIKASVAGGIADDKGVVSYCTATQPVNCA